MAERGAHSKDQFIERLTPRESEVLVLLADGLTNQQIAEKLVLAVTSIKWYNTQIFGKLGVKNRRNAVARATELGLLPSLGDSLAHPRHNLPVQTTQFIGRQRELDELVTLLSDPDVRLTTILAAGGMGKTRLALEAGKKFVAAKRTGHAVSLQGFDGVYFAPLAAISDPTHIVTAIGQHTGFQFQSDGRKPKQQILDYLREKRWLLIFDNCEHLLDGVDFLSEILAAAPSVKLLATSRERLKLSGETVYTISGMAYDERATPENALEYDAMRLFIQGAQSTGTDFALHADELDFLARICRLTEGMPLAILLASAWVDTLSLEEIAEEIQASVDFLAAARRDTPERHHSIRAVFEPTWKRLSEDERDVFMKFSVFRGGCTREAAQVMAGATLPDLQAMVSKALIRREPESQRYEIHELLRQYGADQLENSGESEATRDAHTKYFAAFMREREDDLKSHRQVEALAEIDADFDNILAGFHWSVSQMQYEVINNYLEGLQIYFIYRLRWAEATELFQAATTRLTGFRDHEQKRVYGRVLARFGMFLNRTNPPAQDVLAQALAIARETDDHTEVAFCLTEVATCIDVDIDIREQGVSESIELYRQLGDKYGLAIALYQQGFLTAGHHDRLDQGMALWLESEALSREIGDGFFTLAVRDNIALGLIAIGKRAEAEQLFNELLNHAQQIGYHNQYLSSLDRLAWIAYERGDIDEAEQLVEKRLTSSREFGFYGQHGVPSALSQMGKIALSRGDYDEALRDAHEAMPLGRKHTQHFHTTQLLGTLSVMGLALCGLGDYEGARGYLCELLELAPNDWTPNIVPNQLMSLWGLSLVMASLGAPERAAELAALVAHHPQFQTWIPERHPLFSTLTTELKAELSPEIFAAAWERGQALKLDTVVTEVLQTCEA